MRLRVDPVRCQGNGACAAAAPEVFAVGDDGRAVLLEEEPAEDQKARVRQAARRCPTQAISLEA